MKNYLVVLLMCCSFSVAAAPQWCSGNVDTVYLSNDGSLVIRGDWRNDYTVLCSINTTRQGIAPELCKGWRSMTMSGKLSKTRMIVHYANLQSCSSIPTYASAPSPVYVMLAN